VKRRRWPIGQVYIKRCEKRKEEKDGEKRKRERERESV
jgi:hypothetical protein